MKELHLPKQYKTIHELDFKNLFVSGCSFTHNGSEKYRVSWPYFLQSYANIDRLVSTAMTGAGNYHIANSLIWELEQQNPNPNDTLVVVMWSGIERDDAIISSEFLKDYPITIEYTDGVVAGISGGINGVGNYPSPVNQSKSIESRSVENFLYYTTTYHYLKSKGYRFVFLKYLDPAQPNRSGDFVNVHQSKCDYMFDDIQTIYDFAIRNCMLWDDDFHPSVKGHADWTREILLPHLVDKFK